MVSLPRSTGSSSFPPPSIPSLRDGEKLLMPVAVPYQPDTQQLPEHIFMGNALLSK